MYLENLAFHFEYDFVHEGHIFLSWWIHNNIKIRVEKLNEKEKRAINQRSKILSSPTSTSLNFSIAVWWYLNLVLIALSRLDFSRHPVLQKIWNMIKCYYILNFFWIFIMIDMRSLAIGVEALQMKWSKLTVWIMYQKFLYLQLKPQCALQ